MDEECSPWILRLSNETDKEIFEYLLRSIPEIKIIDQIRLQICELIKLENPSRTFDSKELDGLVEGRIGKCENEKFGCWIYYSWKKCLVHLLEEEDYIRIRTVRNRYKLTEEEQERLKVKKIGVIGLSVGQSAAIGIAQERLCGELRIADFDNLELSNLNRIRTSVTNLGVKKTTILSREIAELDPFIKVVVFDEGINKSNIDAFLFDGGSLDLIVEECDSLDVKILVREKAKLNSIPVVMDTSDRGLLDIERFDLDSKYPILHGLIEEDVSSDYLSTLRSSEDKLPYLLPILDVEGLSYRFRASGLQVGKTITTWPQLASDVNLGGALITHVTRRILLGERLISGRHYIDLNELIVAEVQLDFRQNKSAYDLTESFMAKLAKDVDCMPGTDLDISILEEAIYYAGLAPSAGNNQNWKWYFHAGVLYLFVDPQKTVEFGDNERLGSYLNVGCTLANIILYFNSVGIQFEEINIDPRLQFPLVAVLRIDSIHASKMRNEAALKLMLERRTNRSKEIIRPLDMRDCQEIKKNWSSEFGFLHLITDEKIIGSLRYLVQKGDRFRLTHLVGHDEFFNKEIRWPNMHEDLKYDGLEIEKLGLTPLELAGLQLSKDRRVVEFLNKINGGEGFERISEKSFPIGCGVMMIFAENYFPRDLIECGKAIENHWLRMTNKGYSVYPITVLPMMLTYLNSDVNGFMSIAHIDFLTWIRSELVYLIPSFSDKQLIYFARVSVSPDSGLRSRRRRSSENLVIQ